MIRPYPTRVAIRSIACPVTVIEDDLSDPAFATAVAFIMRLLPQTRMVSLPGAAHMLHVDQPGELGRGRHSNDWPGAIARSRAKPAPYLLEQMGLISRKAATQTSARRSCNSPTPANTP